MPAGARLTVRLSPVLEEALSDRVSQGARVSDIVREALEAYLGLCPPLRQTSAAHASDTVSAMSASVSAIASDMADIRARLAQLEEQVSTRTSRRQRQTERQTPSPQEEPQTFDGAKYRLGKLCPRGHDWQGTGQSLRVKNKAGYCLACNASLARARRQARQPPP